MNFKFSQKMIKEMCGLVSYKRGLAFYKAQKVTIDKYSPDLCLATVKGTEDFHVKLQKDKNGELATQCTCPSLSSYQKDCQHIAAVLLAIYDNQQQAAMPTEAKGQEGILTNNLFSIFQNQPVRTSARQKHFESRTLLEVQFKLVYFSSMLGIELKVETHPVNNIRTFLLDIKAGNTRQVSSNLTYHPTEHYFEEETHAIIQQLIGVVQDEKIYADDLQENANILIIPPTSWEVLKPLLSRKIECAKISSKKHPLHFELQEAQAQGYVLKMFGMNHIVVLDDYLIALLDGKVISLEEEDTLRLIELKKMLNQTGTNQIPIQQEQIDFFLKRVVPGLKKLGNVHISEKISNKLSQVPLVAKLYLDRVSNRLLAGLEFQYEEITFNPLESKQIRAIVRDVEKENRILEIMDHSSFAKTEGGYFLQNEDLEYEFLYHVLPTLQGLVGVYATTAVRNRISRESFKPLIRVKVKKERMNWLEFKFEMDGIPQNHIKEVLQALEEKRKYYRLPNGSLLSLQTREYEEIQRFLNAGPIQNEDLEKGLEVPLVRGLHLLDSVDHSDIISIEETFRQFLEDLSHPDRLEIEIPKSVESILRDYQIHGYKWMKTIAQYGFGGILADDMGLGKTLQAITFILSELSTIRAKERPILIVCPSSLTYNWLSEFMKFAPDVAAVVVDGHQSERAKVQKDIAGIDCLITSYPLLLKDIPWYEKQSFHTVFFDEAQAFKNPLTQTAKMVKKLQAQYRFALTGTPVENSLVELWSIFHVVFPELFLGIKEFSHLTRAKIARRIRPFLLRRLKEDVIPELPDKVEMIESVELLPDQKKLYAAYLAKLRHDTLKHLDKETFRKNKIKILAGLTRLRQICCHPGLFVDGYKGSSSKFEQLMEIVKEARASGRRLLIFSQFTKMLNLIGKDLLDKDFPFFYLDGLTPSEERVELCNRYNAGERDIFLISLKAGGTGLNLTGADTVILYDLWWNPAVEEQAADRAHRLGQDQEVQVIKLIARGTIEEKMNELQEKKRHLIEEIIDVDDRKPTSLTEEDIREILMLDTV